MESAENLTDKLKNVLDSHIEWILIEQSGSTFPFLKNEIEIEHDGKKTLVSFLDNRGFQTWRIFDCNIEEDRISLELRRNFGKEAARIELIPRAKANEFSETVELARLQRANKIAQLIVSGTKNTKLIRVELNKENGRFAQITIENKIGSQTAVLADVSDSLTPEVLLSLAIILLLRFKRRKKKPIGEIWVLGEDRAIGKLQKLHACLKNNPKCKIKLKKISRLVKENVKQTSAEEKPGFVKIKTLEIANLWNYKPSKLGVSEGMDLTDLAREIVSLSPQEIDHVFSLNGETLRYLGLPFVRVRRALEKEKVWFGIEHRRRILNDNSYPDFAEMVENLRRYRRFDSPNKQHAFYKLSPEAWLESILKSNIKQLDANLILSPIYNQFRTSQDRIDLLALRKDGRLVIIELKVSADREMVFQAVDYWRKIELQRRRGKLNHAKLFGELEIADKPTIIYLVAPTLSFHRDFELLSNTLSKEIEMFRFDLTENWRENLKVLGRQKVG